MDDPKDRVAQCTIELKWYEYTVNFPEERGRPSELTVSTSETEEMTIQERIEFAKEVAEEYDLNSESMNDEMVRIFPPEHSEENETNE